MPRDMDESPAEHDDRSDRRDFGRSPASLAIRITASLFLAFAILKATLAAGALSNGSELNEMADRSASAPAGTIGRSLHELQVNFAKTQRRNGLLASIESVVFVFTGLFLYLQSQRWFCMMGAGLACLTIPLGTGLGVATIVLLTHSAAPATGPPMQKIAG